MAVVLALLSAVAYGVADYVGGVVAGKVSPWQVAMVAMSAALIGSVPLGLIAGGDPSSSDWVLAFVGGLGAGGGVAFLYRGLMRGRMSVVAPLSGVTAALVPVVVGIATGDRPSVLALVGVAFAVPAIALVAGGAGDEPADGATPRTSAADATVVGAAPSDPARGSIVDGLLAGAGFGIQYAAAGSFTEDAGLIVMPVLEIGGVLGVIAVAMLVGEAWIPRDRAALPAWVCGALSLAAVVLVTIAGRDGLTSIISVIAALYPAVTVLLAAILLRERIARLQGVGLTLAAAAVALVVLG